jgi:beta-lactamase regulating signal transducer with metallopeptidase domain
MVEDVATRIGLGHVPETLMTHGALSPMVSLGRNPKLLLPAELWAVFDDASREAIICHELAHLRRRDHWVCWADVAVGALYWWHPLVWWIRRRLQNEAEFCCDAWVTWLLPRGRRAYAEALLITKQFVHDQSRSVPAVGIGITSGRARRFGRRLTMVMTQTNRPGLSASGIALAAALAMAGWAAAPARSCPDDETGARVKTGSTVVWSGDCSKHTKSCEKCPGTAASARRTATTVNTLPPSSSTWPTKRNAPSSRVMC